MQNAKTRARRIQCYSNNSLIKSQSKHNSFSVPSIHLFAISINYGYRVIDTRSQNSAL